MKRMIVDLLEKFAIGLFALYLLVGLIVGGVAGSAGGAVGAIVGAIIGLLLGFVMGVLIFGVIFVLLEMNESLRAIRQHFETRRP